MNSVSYPKINSYPLTKIYRHVRITVIIYSLKLQLIIETQKFTHNIGA